MAKQPKPPSRGLQIGQRIAAARIAADLNQEQLAEKIRIAAKGEYTTSQTVITNHETGKVLRWEIRLLFWCTKVLPGLYLADLEPILAPPITPQGDLFRPGQLLVYGSSGLIEGAGSTAATFRMSTEPVRSVTMPEPLETVRGGYGVLMPDDTMVPRYFLGDILLVNPGASHIPGEPHLFRAPEDDPANYACVAVLLGTTETDWMVYQYAAPPDRQPKFYLKLSEFPRCHRIVGSYSRFR